MASQSRRRVLRGNPLLRERRHDPYRSNEKPAESTRCPDCGVQFRNGRWSWPKASQRGFRNLRCPACRRIADRYPAGELRLSGAFLSEHYDEILATIRHIEDAERSEHPLHRIMSIDERDGEVTIATTDIHLPHQMAHALKDAFGGTTKIHYDLNGYFTRVNWSHGD